MRFTKMHGAGNDYVYVNCFEEPMPDDPAALARRVSDRHFGIGGDGLILICPSTTADARMRMFNADGSEAEMCGNGIRCVAKYVYDHDICRNQDAADRDGQRRAQLGTGNRRRKGPPRAGRHGRADPRAGPHPRRLARPSRADRIVDVPADNYIPSASRRLRCRRLRLGPANDVRFDGQPARYFVLPQRGDGSAGADRARTWSGSRFSPSGSTCISSKCNRPAK